MAALRSPDNAPDTFVLALERLRAVRLRAEISVTEVPAPQRIAPYAVALSAEVLDGDDELAVGRFILFHDPAGQESWEGTFRAVTFARAELEPEFGGDQMLGQIGWAWVEEALAGSGAEYRAHGGTVTRTVSESFGSLSEREPVVELEIRTSWTPLGDVGLHLQAWASMLCTVAGLPGLPEGVAALPRRR